MIQYLTNSAIKRSAILILNRVKTKFQILDSAKLERALIFDRIILEIYYILLYYAIGFPSECLRL
jgi:hypothetical protein